MDLQELEVLAENRHRDEMMTYLTEFSEVVAKYQEVKRKRNEWFKAEKKKLKQQQKSVT